VPLTPTNLIALHHSQAAFISFFCETCCQFKGNYAARRLKMEMPAKLELERNEGEFIFSWNL
jgi:hypothetical protein